MMKIISVALLVVAVTTTLVSGAQDSIFAQDSILVDSESWWAQDKRAGAAGRPFISDLVVVHTSGTTETIMSGLTTPAPCPKATGKLFAVVTPVNLCNTDGILLSRQAQAMHRGGSEGETAAPGAPPPASKCVTSPMHAVVSLGVAQSDGTVTADLTGTVYATAEIDLTINLQTWNDIHQWSWVNGDLNKYYFDEKKGTLRFQIKPVDTPKFPSLKSINGGDNCCDCHQPKNCDVQKAIGHYIAARVLMNWAVRDAYVAELPYAVFASKGAWFSSMWIKSTKNADGTFNNTVNIASVGAHYRSDGVTLSKGSLYAVLPKQSYKHIWPSLTGAAMSGKLNFAPDAKTTKAPTVEAKVEGAGNLGTTALTLSVIDQTFSIPTYGASAEGPEYKYLGASAVLGSVVVGTLMSILLLL